MTKKYINAVLTFSSLAIVSSFLLSNGVAAYGECSEYGVMAMYDSLSNNCKCVSGYIFGKDFLGKTSCVSGDNVCHEKYGYNSRYDSIDDSCECSYGYVFGKDSIGRTQCVSPDSICTDQLGYNARYNSLYDKCECRSGYVISGGRCTDGDGVCHSKHGLYSSYNDLNNSCECDSGYTFDDSNQCVKKQNNVYFTLKELDTDERKAIIKSDYDYRYYLISYNSGCYSSSFRRYLNHQIVVNVGTDFDLDTWDKIVLQDDNEVCDIARVDRADSSTSLKLEEENNFYYDANPSAVNLAKPIYQTPPTQVIKNKKEFQFDETIKKDFGVKISGESNVSGALRKCPSTTECDVMKYIDPKTKVDILGSYNNEEWYRVSINSTLSGWMHSTVLNKISQKEDDVSETIVAQTQLQEDFLWYKKIFNFIKRLFK